MTSPRARVWLGLWTAVIVACVVPWIGWQDHSHWTRIGWVPFSSPPVRLRDVVINAVLYVPFGLFCHRALRPHWSGHARFVMLWALALSISTEASQIYSHGRFPSATDVTTNVIGAGLGVLLGSPLGLRLTARQGVRRSKAAISRRFRTSRRPSSRAR